jgi:deoxyribonuclease-1-like protein
MNKIYCFFFLLFFNIFFAQIKICSWNIENFGKSKSNETIDFIANSIQEFDVVAIQEVVAGKGGAQAVARLAEIINRKGAKWDYTISEPTTSTAYKTERYGFLWKTSKLKLKNSPWLEQKYNLEIDREPYFATFEINDKKFTIVNFHAITKNKQPETEIKYFKFLPNEYPTLNLVFLGDFNCPQSHTVFIPLIKMGYNSVFKGQKTSLKRSCQNDNCLASEFDNIFYDISKINLLSSGVYLFYNKFENLELARKVSDHIPVWAIIELK